MLSGRIIPLSDKNSGKIRRWKQSFLPVLFLFPFISFLFAQESEIKFSRLTIEDGLSQNSVQCIVQDQAGFIWLGTTEGLNKYDGRSFISYLYEPDNPNSLSENNIRALYLDHSGILWIGTGDGFNRLDPATMEFTRLLYDPDDPRSICDDSIRCIHKDRQRVMWIGTEGGLSRFNPTSNRFENFIHQPDDPDSLSHNYVTSIYEDQIGTLWIGTLGGGLNILDRETGKFTRLKNDRKDPASLSDDAVHCVYQDRSGILWIGTENGLNQFKPDNKNFTRYFHKPGDPKSLSSGWIMVVFEDSSGAFWVGIEGGGLNRFDRATGEFTVYQARPENPSSLSDNRIYSLFEDRTGMLWIGTWNGGVSLLNRYSKRFVHYKNIQNDPNSLSDNIVYAIREDSFGLLWLGTSNGLNRYDKGSGHLTRYYHDPHNPFSISDNGIFSIVEDAAGDLWIGTRNGGLNRYLRDENRFIPFRHNSNDSNSLSYDAVWTLCIDHLGEIWAGTGGGGLNRFNPQSGKFIRYRHRGDDPFSLGHDFIAALLEDRSGAMWIGSEVGGLSRFDRETGHFQNYLHNDNDTSSLSHNYVMVILEDSLGAMWLGTGNGLNRFDRQTEKFLHFSMKDGLPNNTIYGLQEDDQGYLWISTNKGLSKFDPRALTFKNFDNKDGLQSNEFNAGAYYKSPKGELFFGGVNGFNSFFPDQIRDNPNIPPVVLTDFKVMNQAVPIGREMQGRIILQKCITYTDNLVLSHKDRVFSFEFSALNYMHPEKNKYAYIMENFEKEWTQAGTRNFVMYSNLPPGDFVFRVKGSNNDGLWNEEGISLHIKVTPPFWQTAWFRVVGIFTGLFFIIAVFQLRTKSIRRRNVELEQRVEARTIELQQEIKERRRVEKEIEKRQKYLESVLHGAPEAIVTVDADHHIIEWNPGAEKIFGYTRGEVLGKDLNNFVSRSEVWEEAMTLTQKALKGERVPPQETIRYRKDGVPRNVIVAGSPIRIGGELQGVVVVYSDITERIRAEESIKASLVEKEVLLKEIHHRVKNNMQIISSLLNLQSAHIKDQQALELFRESKDRVRSMALIHEKLYRSQDLARIDFKEYIHSLATSIFQSYKAEPTKINLDIRIKDIFLPVDKAVPCGLVMNELLSNCLKYAFPATWKGQAKIEIGLRKMNGNMIELMVKDNGIGLPQELNFRKTGSLGLHLVVILGEGQLEGEIDVERQKGTTFLLRFKSES